MKLDDAKTVFMLGIAGTGMRGLAHILHEQGKHIIGIDEALEDVSNDLSVYDMVDMEAARDAILKADVLIHTDAVRVDHPLRIIAKKNKVFSLAYHEALGEVSSGYTTIAVTGTHGKSSTTAFLAHVLVEAGLDPTALVGAGMPSWSGRNARVGKSKFFVVEADEYREHFLALHPHCAVVTNIDFDHPDFFADIDAVKHSYDLFLRNVVLDGSAITHTSVRDSFPDLAWPDNTLLVDEVVSAPLPGIHMGYNAGLAVRAACMLGVSRDDAVRALESFPGLERRFEHIGEFHSMHVISDYGHHPKEIKATLLAVREKFSDKKILVVFEAHMYERLHTFLNEFCDALGGADGVLVYPPFLPSGRKYAGELADVRTLADCVRKSGVVVEVMSSAKDLSLLLDRFSSDFDVVIAFTAGFLDRDIRKIVT